MARLCDLAVRVPGYKSKRSRVRFPALPSFVFRNGSGTRSFWPSEVN
jgi:hypothetical protein